MRMPEVVFVAVTEEVARLISVGFVGETRGTHRLTRADRRRR
jgi:hypothetical protein